MDIEFAVFFSRTILLNSYNEIHKEVKKGVFMKTFDLCDLNEEFWGKLVFFMIHHDLSYGSLGRLEMVTEDKKYYFLKLEALPFSEYRLGEHFDFFRRIDKFESNHKVYAIENEGWTYLIEHHVMVRDDILPAYKGALEKMNEGKCNTINYPPISRIAWALDASDDELEFIEYVNNKPGKSLKEYPELKDRKKNCLTEADMDWKPVYEGAWSSKQLTSEVALLFKEEKGRVVGEKYTICHQEGRRKGDGCIIHSGDMIYNLFLKEYSDVIGPLHFPEINKEIKGEYASTYYDWITFDAYEAENLGKLLFSFTSLEDAKAYALWYANSNGNVKRDRRITDLDNVDRDYTRRIQRCEAYRAYKEHFNEIMEVVCNYDSSLETFWGESSSLMEAILDAVPDITSEQLRIIWPDIPKVLEQGTQRCIEKEIKRCHGYKARYVKRV